MKKLLLIGLMLCSISLCLSVQAKSTPSSQSLDQIVVVVNDDVITTSELNHAIAVAKIQMTQQRLPIPSNKILQKQVIDQLINNKLQMQLARQAGVTISDDELNTIVARIAKQNNVSVKELYRHVNQDGMSTEEYRHQLRDQVTLQKLQQQELGGKITLTPAEVTSFMHSQNWQNNISKEYHLEDILIPFSDTPSSDEIIAAKKQAQSILLKLQQGQSFQEVAQADSSGTHALQGGDLGWRKLPEIPSAFADRVIKMHAKEIIGPIQAPNGFHIIRLVAVRTLTSPHDLPTRKQVEGLLMQQKFEEAVQNWVSKLRNQAFIQINVPK